MFAQINYKAVLILIERRKYEKEWRWVLLAFHFSLILNTQNLQIGFVLLQHVCHC